jgi:DNA polymerase-3 subunit epsilon/CBS domain-containing protein
MSFESVPHECSAMPLAALPMVVLDTETTGLDAARDRVIEIGAVRPVPGQPVTDDDVIATLVNPGIAIPAASTAIHGLSDKDVADAPAFPLAMADIAAWTGARIVIGYSIGFDIAVLKAEHVRHGMIWRAPRSLDVAHLVHILAPNLPNPSIETAAGWLGIDVSYRHRALGDALVTGQIFRALLPRLRASGILTLAQAERACRSLTARLDGEARAGWDMPAYDTAGAQSVPELARIDSFPYRHRVADLMTSPPVRRPDAIPLREAMSAMVESRVSALVLDPANPASKPGIVTERDILRALERGDATMLDQPVSTIGSYPLVAIEGEEFVYRALARMNSKGFRHLAVTGSDGTVVGVLSARDLLRQRADEALSLGDGIERAETAEDLNRVWSDLTTVARALTNEGVDARMVASLISRELRALTEKACRLAEAQMHDSGRGGPPVPYAMMVLGSGGRGESLLAMDQDNAIVYADGAPPQADDWYAELGKTVSDILNDAGVAYCKGGIMAANAEWRMPVGRWRETVRDWIARPRPENIMNCDIFFDARPVHGETDLADTLRQDAIGDAKTARPFLRALALTASRFESPVGWFGRYRLTAGRVDLKMNGILPIFSAARVAALERGLPHRSTPERLRAVRQEGTATERSADNLIEAHRILLNLILRQQLRDVAAGLLLSNAVAPSELTEFDRQELRWALEQVPRIADLLGTPVVG